jgi:TPR repeat protein
MTVKAGKLRNLREANRANELYRRGDEAWSKGRSRPAFRLFLAAARAGMKAAFSTVGNFYHNGIGVKANPDAAIDWYRLAYRAGARSVANNIGCILRDRKKFGQAIE